ncbi:hypothetical protein LJ656_24565 [Paraburkholderia sp. MMS20-SJTR3]|uniref:CdiI immunity protein domain-containing protein n=1 Tax=Paraburkholderia sejongensis TaxID=2886946 RepID=A0ABS8K0U3_9BURK|nr:contact-dependent growth inhibition system immunity protein [Paraburkholderia sp. MMS20-SJTR3]MCC8395762.1 hypothetical protein [Paraburkholderia sp. MMS20-SJTR3]
MEKTESYPQLTNFLESCFGEDVELWGDTIEDIVALYKSENPPAAQLILIDDINRFSCDHGQNLDDAFAAAYDFTFDPVPWGHTTASFFELVKRLLKE